MPDPPNDALRDYGARMPDTLHTPELTNAEPAAGLDGSGWRLPSGEDLISFALGVGLAAVPLVQLNGGGARRPDSDGVPRTRARRRPAGRGARAAARTAIDGKEVR
jgi:hypothetical protein